MGKAGDHSVFYVLYSGGFYIALSWQVTHLSSFPSLTAGVPAFQSRTVWRVPTANDVYVQTMRKSLRARPRKTGKLEIW